MTVHKIGAFLASLNGGIFLGKGSLGLRQRPRPGFLESIRSLILSRQEAELIQHDQKICVRQETAAPYEGDLSGARRSDVPYPTGIRQATRLPTTSEVSWSQL